MSWMRETPAKWAFCGAWPRRELFPNPLVSADVCSRSLMVLPLAITQSSVL